MVFIFRFLFLRVRASVKSSVLFVFVTLTFDTKPCGTKSVAQESVTQRSALFQQLFF